MKAKTKCVLLLFVASVLAATPAFSETPEEFAARTKWFREAKFGMFIHWGVYSVLGHAEWVMYHQKIQVADYEKLPPRFKPTKFDAREWVALAKKAGMKYITVTTKHHDGFCMFRSRFTTYDAVDAAPLHRDFIKELVDACHEAGIKICFYYSLLDWHHPDYLPRRPWEKKTRPADGADFARYVAYAHGQVRELCTNYGKIDGIWFDGGWEHSAQEWQADKLIAMIRELQPGCIINNRARVPADFDTPEQHVPKSKLRAGRLWETCMTINHSWGYNKDDHNYKSIPTLLHTLADIAHKGGNLLLNVGPKPDGTIQDEFVQRLLAMGIWMRANGASLYATTAGPFDQLPFGRCTRRGDRLYLHVFDWPKYRLVVPRLRTPVVRARLLCDRTPVPFSQREGALYLDTRNLRPDPVDTVIVLDCRGTPIVDNAVYPSADGRLLLHASRATVHGANAHYESGGGKDNIGYWTRKEDWVSWEVVVKRPGLYQVRLTYACTSGSAGSTYQVLLGKSRLQGKVDGTGDWTKFVAVDLGLAKLDAGRLTVAVKPLTMPHGAVMNLQKIELTPTGVASDVR